MPRQQSHYRDNKSLTHTENFQDLLGFELGPSCLTNEGTTKHPTQPQSGNLPPPPPPYNMRQQASNLNHALKVHQRYFRVCSFGKIKSRVKCLSFMPTYYWQSSFSCGVVCTWMSIYYVLWGEYLMSLLPELYVLMSSMKGGWDKLRKGRKDWVTLQTQLCKAKAKLLIYLLYH